jgi:flagellar biosynthesis/type III secretory pathway chaperone
MVMSALHTALDTHLNLLKELLSLLKRETGEMSEVHLDAMTEINGRKEEITGRIQKNSETLRQTIDETASQEGLDSKATLGELAARFKQKGDTEVSRLHKELNATTDQIKELLNLNREIAERFAASLTSSLELLSRIINQSNTYGASGGYQQRLTGAVMINREA